MVKQNSQKYLHVGMIQYPLVNGRPAENAETLKKIILQMLRAPCPDLILLPEIFLGGPASRLERLITSDIYKDFERFLMVTARQFKTAFFGATFERSGQQFYNSAIFITPQGLRKVLYRKIHLFRFDQEHRIFGSGQTIKIHKTPWGKIAPLICYDLRFPEVLRKATFAGAQLALVCAQWPASRREHWLSLLKARAIENQMFVIACNRTGTKKNLTFSGDSCVFSPWGELQFHLKNGDVSGKCKINLAEVAHVRGKYPFLKDAKAKILF